MREILQLLQLRTLKMMSENNVRINKFLSQAGSDDDGYVAAYSDDASEDYIYDIQDEWNLAFYLD